LAKYIGLALSASLLNNIADLQRLQNVAYLIPSLSFDCGGVSKFDEFG